jgi:transposase InsO family protein
MRAKAIQWYHETLMHPGETRTELTMGQHFTWEGMQKAIQQACKRCQQCQLTKPKVRQVGHLPAKVAEEGPWERLCIDLIGPYIIGSKGNESKLHCLTMIDPVTGWFEIAEIRDKSSYTVMDVLEQTWLTRYPKPTEIISDRGTEFMGEVRQSLQNDYGIAVVNSTTRNPQSNAMLERAHKTLHDLIAALDLRSKEHVDAHHGWKGILAAVAFAMRATVHSTAKATPMQLVFGRDAIFNVRFQADWHYLNARRQRMILHNNEKENAKRIPHTYQVGDPVMIQNYQHRKYGQPRYSGPYDIDRVNDNGTVRLRQTTANGGAVYRTWNIRNIFPFKA